MNIQENVSLVAYSTMRLGGSARYLTEVNTRQEMQQAVTFAFQNNLPSIVIGGGSNLVWKDEGYPGLVIVNKIMRFEPFQEDETNLYLTLGAGEDWDSVVQRSVEMGYSGIEQLSLIPGTVGATPVQNVGAYGREISEVLVSVEAYDSQTQQFVTIPTSDCAFGYRTSRFKTSDKGRFYITGLVIHLMKMNPTPPFYGSLQTYFDEHSITNFTPQVVREAVVAIRTSKLPNPKTMANNGSFFANPIVEHNQLTQLAADHPGIMYWEQEGGKVKLSAAWMVENAGFKGVHDQETGMATWDKQAIVLVNEHAKSTADLLKFRDKIIAAVQTKFGITLQQEPELVG